MLGIDMTYNRKDNDGHKFNVPEDLLGQFDAVFERYCNAKRMSDEYYEAEAEFCNRFEKYMVG